MKTEFIKLGTPRTRREKRDAARRIRDGETSRATAPCSFAGCRDKIGAMPLRDDELRPEPKQKKKRALKSSKRADEPARQRFRVTSEENDALTRLFVQERPNESQRLFKAWMREKLLAARPGDVPEFPALETEENTRPIRISAELYPKDVEKLGVLIEAGGEHCDFSRFARWRFFGTLD